MNRYCTCCGKLFELRPQIPDQIYCSAPDCQRARKRQWQRTKLKSDPDYRINQRAAQQAWSQRNQNYWRDYREAKSDPERNQQQHWSRDAPQWTQVREAGLAKMDVCDLPSGLYRITRHPSVSAEHGGSWVVEITPVRVARPRKMDASREDLIDGSSTRP
jgi:hypothetical protein